LPDPTLPFCRSEPLTLGVEIELMLLDRDSGELVAAAPVLLGQLAMREREKHIKAEVTQAMIELNSSVHHHVGELASEILSCGSHVAAVADSLHLAICGGGAHPFRTWERRVIYPAPRFEKFHEAFGYLAKQFTVFGQHVHVGVASAEDSIYLTHAFNRYVPHMIAISAGSPFQRGVDTSFQSTRVNVASVLPLSGHMPAVASWDEFSTYFSRMRDTGVVESMKDFYWDVRPKPEFGTVEVRAPDTPVTLEQAVDFAAFVQALASYCLANRRPIDVSRLYEAYEVNRMVSARFGFDAILVDLAARRRVALHDELIALLESLALHAIGEDARRRLQILTARVQRRDNDAAWMRDRLRALGDFRSLMLEQSARLLEPRQAAGGAV
jgi:glutamate---cysteine ligase / carboxylate-amine ligase